MMTLPLIMTAASATPVYAQTHTPDPGCSIDAYEPDNNYLQAQWITTDGVQQTHNNTNPASEEDWVKFTAAAGHTYQIRTMLLNDINEYDTAANDTLLYLYGTDGTTQLAFNDDVGYATWYLGYYYYRESFITWTAPAAGVYFAEELQWGPTAGYTIRDCHAYSLWVQDITNQNTATTTTVAAVPNPTAVGSGTAITATVTGGSGTSTPTGTVSFGTSGTGNFTPVTCTLLASGSGTASCSVTYTPASVGTDAITAFYYGDATFLPSSGNTNLTVTARNPVLTVVKSTTTTTVTAAGQVVNYTYLVSNTGNVTVTGISLSDNNIDPGSLTCPATSLAVGTNMTCTAQHTVTQAEIDADGNLSNTVTANSTKSAPATGTYSIPISQNPAIHVVKSSTTTSISNAGQLVPYVFTITNTGNMTLSGITVADPNCGAPPLYVSGDTNVDTKLQTTETWIYTCSHTVTQAEIDADGNLSNTVTANSTESAPATSTYSIPISQNPAIHVVKSSTTTSISNAGQLVPYVFTITNTGNMTLSGITVADPNCDAAPAYQSGDTNADSKLQTTETWTYTCSHTVTQAEIDAGGNLSNTVTAHSTESAPATGTYSIPISQNPAIHVVKSSTTTSISNAGQLVPYVFTITNTGNMTLSGITVADPNCDAAPAYQSGDTNADSKLQTTETWTYTCSHTVTQAEIDADGNLSNTVTANSTKSAPATDTYSIPISQNPAIHVAKSSTTTSISNAGQLVPYVFTITNTGNMTLSGITVADPNCDAAPAYQSGDTNADSKLQTTETWTYTCSHTVTQAEIDAGGNLSNTVTANSTKSAPATGTYFIPISQNPAIHVAKSSTTTSISNAGQVVPYVFTITNTGNMTLSGITVADPNCDAAPAYQSGDTNADSKLQTTETWTYTCSHTVTQAEIDADGNLSNTVTAHSTESAPATDTYSIPTTPAPEIHVVKSSTTTSISNAGQLVPYVFTITNTGNMTLSGITVADPNCDAAPAYQSGDTNADSKLQTTETWTYTCSHTVTQAEIDADGNLSNTVTAHSTESAPATSTYFIPISQNPAIHVAKSSTTTSISNAGQVVPYVFTITNTGNMTLSGITVTDPNCGAPPLYVSGDTNVDTKLQTTETWIYTCSHTVTQAEIDADGNLSNTVTANSTESAPATGTYSIPISQNPAIHVVKSSTTTSISNAGQLVPYVFTITNTGNMTLSGITVADPNCGAPPLYVSGDTNVDTKLQTTETWIYTCSHTVTQAEIDADGNLSNTVTANSTESAPATGTYSIPISQNPAIHVVKSSTTTSISNAGQLVPYVFTITNTGNMTLSGITVADPNCGAPPSYVSGDTNVDTKLQTTETWIYTCSHTVTQAEIDADGNLSNTVTANSTESAPATSTYSIPISQNPAIHVVKSSTTTSISNAGQLVPYVFTITNTGNMTLSGITVADPNCDAAPAYQSGDTNADSKLQTTETWTYTCSHTVTQAEIDAGGNLSNTVTAHSTESAPATGTYSIPISQNPAIHVVKSSTTTSISNAGQLVPYVFTITNTGNMTLSGITVADPNCDAAPAYQSGDTNADSKLQTTETWTYTCSHTVTQAEIEAGGYLSNTVTVSSTNAPQVTNSYNIPITQSPGLSVVKSETSTGPYVLGNTITYSILVTNTGNITLTNVTASDSSAIVGTCTPAQPTSLTPSASMSCPATHVVTQADIDNGSYTNTATGTSNQAGPKTSTFTVNFTQSPGLSVVKSEISTGPYVLGNTITYSIVVTNTGNITLTNVTASDSSAIVGTCTPAQPTSLTPSASMSCPATHIVTQADIDNGSYTNTATGTSNQAGPKTSTVTVIFGTSSNSISGTVFNDANSNGIQDIGEPGLAGVTVTLYNQSNKVVVTTTTALDGSYSFINLPPGIYAVVETNPVGYLSTTLDHVTVVLSSGTHPMVNFGDLQTGASVVDPAVTKFGNPSSAVIGDTVIFTITVGNNGNADALNVVLTDTKPSFLTILSINISPDQNFPVIISGNTFTIRFGTVTPTDFYTVTVITVVNQLGAPPGGDNNVSITTSSPGDPIYNDQASAHLTILGKGLPSTGFAPGAVTSLAAEPDHLYNSSNILTIEIPTLGVKTTIVGVPPAGGTWDVTWLGDQVGYLEGTAFPTWSGNSVVTGHVYGADGLPGPFVNLKTLKWGDQVIIHLAGQRYIYEVRTNQVISPTDTSIFSHKDYPWLTLLTCKDYNALTNSYAHRVVVGAVLIKIELDPPPGP